MFENLPFAHLREDLLGLMLGFSEDATFSTSAGAASAQIAPQLTRN